MKFIVNDKWQIPMFCWPIAIMLIATGLILRAAIGVIDSLLELIAVIPVEGERS